MSISSPTLAYIHFGRNTYNNEPQYTLAGIQPLLERYPLLNAVDIAYRDELYEPISVVLRYSRGGGVPELVGMRRKWTFEGWWERLTDELKLYPCI
ncbi:hypothetical protein ONZ45_g4052 [Pleurotus djamor]|nr:hypothetical protein ONZ45_g4052 [Pleurotus djamor]